MAGVGAVIACGSLSTVPDAAGDCIATIHSALCHSSRPKLPAGHAARHDGTTMPRPFHRNLTVQVLTAIVAGVLVGHLRPDWGRALKPVGDAFINLVKMIVAPVVFLTIVVGIAGMRDLRKAGRVGLKAIGYFLAVTTLALTIGIYVANVAPPGPV